MLRTSITCASVVGAGVPEISAGCGDAAAAAAAAVAVAVVAVAVPELALFMSLVVVDGDEARWGWRTRTRPGQIMKKRERILENKQVTLGRFHDFDK